MELNPKRIGLIAMLIAVVGLSATAIFIGLRLRQPVPTTPDPAAACDPACNEGNKCYDDPALFCCDDPANTPGCDMSWTGGYYCDCGGGGDDDGDGGDGSDPYTEYVTFSCPGGCNEFNQCHDNFSFGNSPGSCNQVDRCRPGTEDCVVVSLCDDSCSGGGDDGGDDDGGGTTGPNPSCGDGVLDTGEVCDPGSTATSVCEGGGTCLPNCTCEIEVTDVVVDIEKTASETCSPDSTETLVTYTVTVENLGAESIITNVIDEIDADITQYINEESIQNGGVLDSAQNTITWADIELDSDESVVFTYTATIPDSEFGETFVNTVRVEDEEEEELDRDSVSITPVCEELPTTAIFGDFVDRVLLGALLLIMGVVAYRIDINHRLWNSFKEIGGRYLLVGVDKESRKYVTDRKKDKLESRFRK